MKKKVKKDTGKKASGRSKKASESKELSSSEVLKNIAAMIKEQAPQIAKAVIDEGKKGQLSPAKFLFEMAHIFPLETDISQTSKDEESLAETLLDALKIPKTPVVHDLLQKDEEEDSVVIQPVKVAEESSDKTEEEVGVVVAQ